MGTRKDKHNKRQLSIIDETDYFSDEGHSQGQDVEKVDTLNHIVPILGMSHLPLSSKWGLYETGSCVNVYDISCLSSAGGDHYSNGINVINETNRQRQCDLDGESKPLASLVNGESPSESYDVQNAASEIKTFDINVVNGYALVDEAMDCIRNRDVSRSPSGVEIESKIVCNSLVAHEYSKPTSNQDHSLHVTNSLEINGKGGSVDSFKNVKASNMDSIHEMFQILIKCIEGTQNEKQHRFIGAEPEETCKNSPLFYLLEEKVEKPPQGVGNIISSFKKKFSQPNAKRIPIRQKSRRSLVLEKLVDPPDLTAETKSLFRTQDCREIKEKEMCAKGCNADQTVDNVYSKESTMVKRRRDNIKSGREEGIFQRYNTDEVIIEEDHQEGKNEFKDCVNFGGEGHANSVKSENENSLVCCVAHPGKYLCRTDSFKSGSFPKAILESKQQQSTPLEAVYITETSSVLNVIPGDKGDTKLAVPSVGNIASDCCQGEQGKRISSDDEPYFVCKESMSLTTCNGSQDGSHQNSMSYMCPQESVESNHKAEKLQIPIFKRDRPKPYEDDKNVNFWSDSESENSIMSKNKASSEAKSKVNLLTVPNAIHVPAQFMPPIPGQQKNQEEKQKTNNISKSQQSTLSPQISSSPNCPTQSGKAITFLNSNGSIARRPMLRHVSQPNMNAHGTSQFAKAPDTVNQTENSPNSQSTESKFQIKDLNSDLAKLKATAERLKLVTRRPSYLEWLEERRKNRAPLDILGIGPAIDKTSENRRMAAFTVGDSKLERIKGKCTSFGLSNSPSVRGRCIGHLRHDACTGKGSSRQSSCNNKGSSDGCSSSDTEIDDDDDDENVFIECDRNGGHVTGLRGVQDVSKQFALHKTTSTVTNLQTPTMWKLYIDRDPLTPSRKERIDKSLAWLRNELKCMRSQDQALAKQLLSLRHEMHKLRLSRSCQEHRDLLDEVQCDLEDIQEFSKVLDLPSTVYLDTPLKNVGVTKLNISTRRFSTS